MTRGIKLGRNFWLVATALLVSLALKAWLVVGGYVPFNADEAVVALMARHILQGERPVFFYGQAYMGSLDAFLVAAGFGLFGQQVWVIRLVQALLYDGVILTTAWLLAIPTVNVTLYTTASLGGYGEALLVGNLLLLVGFRIDDTLQEQSLGRLAGLLLAWGFLAGLGLWAFGLTLEIGRAHV